MKHSVDLRMGITAEQAVWHADSRMEALVADIFEKLAPAWFVETGTHMGWTSMWVAEHFPGVDIITVESDPCYHEVAKENLAGLRLVDCVFGDSRDTLRYLIGGWQGVFRTAEVFTPLFWLDAHFGPDHPLREECEIVASLSRYICLIDDFHCGADFPGDPASTAMVLPSLGKDYWRPAYPYQIGFSGYALFVKDVDYVPPATMRRAT